MGDRLRAGIPSRYITSQLGQLSLASLRGHLIEYQLRLGQRWECHLCRWQVTLCVCVCVCVCVIPYDTRVPVAVRRAVNCYSPFTLPLPHRHLRRLSKPHRTYIMSARPTATAGVAWSVCWSVCLSFTTVRTANAGERTEMPSAV